MDPTSAALDYVKHLEARRRRRNQVSLGKPTYKQFPIVLVGCLKSDRFADELAREFKRECENRRGFDSVLTPMKERILASPASGCLYYVYLGDNHKLSMSKLFVDYFREKGRSSAILSDDYVFDCKNVRFSFLDCKLVPHTESRHKIRLHPSQIVKAAQNLLSASKASLLDIETWDNSCENPEYFEEDAKSCLHRTKQVIRLLSREFGSPKHLGGDELCKLLNLSPILHAAIWEIDLKQLAVCGFSEKSNVCLFLDVRENKKPRKKK